jgi:AMMECR1 domain-containing protein
MASPCNRFQRVEQARSEAVSVELWAASEGIKGSVECPTGGRSGSLVPFVPPEAGMSAEEALAIACHLANVDDGDVVIIDPSGVWRPEWGILY